MLLFFSVLLFFLVSVSVAVKCDWKSHPKTGCEMVNAACDNTTDECSCIDDYPVSWGRFCLERRNVTGRCFVSHQCLGDSKCFQNGLELTGDNFPVELNSTALRSPPGQCQCPNKSKLVANRCKQAAAIGANCTVADDCVQPDSSCNDTTVKRCVCNDGYVFSTLIGHCVLGKFLGQSCTGREECLYSEENSWCIDGICLCGAGYTPEPTFQLNGQRQCILDTLLVEKAEPPRSRKLDNHDVITPLLVLAFIGAFVLAILIARRNRNAIIDLIRPAHNMNNYNYNNIYCDDNFPHVVLMPINNRANGDVADALVSHSQEDAGEQEPVKDDK